MSDHASREEAGLEEEARLRLEQIRATEEAAAQPHAAADTEPTPDEQLAQVNRSGRQHDHTDTAAYAAIPRGRRGPRR